MEVDQINSLLPPEGKTFFIDENEYRVIFVNVPKGRFAAGPHSEIKKIPSVGDKFMIEGNSFIITYVHDTQKRITAKPLSIGY